MFFENKRMTVLEFGNALLDTLDLDPVYVILYKAELGPKLLRRWLLAYSMCYHAGVASKIADSEDFWDTVQKFQDEKWPRGRERRHFRGNASQHSINWMRKKFPIPGLAIKSLEDSGDFVTLKKWILGWPLYGPWIAFKMGDLLERVMGVSIEFSIDDLNFYKEPAEGAKIVKPEWVLKETVGWLNKQFQHRLAPPSFDRPCGTQEAETILCKMKSYLHGHYPIGIDTRELKHALVGWGPLADKLGKCLPFQRNTK
jgi:hypothetical protein